jgi:hypothetical protein
MIIIVSNKTLYVGAGHFHTLSFSPWRRRTNAHNQRPQTSYPHSPCSYHIECGYCQPRQQELSTSTDETQGEATTAATTVVKTFKCQGSLLAAQQDSLPSETPQADDPQQAIPATPETTQAVDPQTTAPASAPQGLSWYRSPLWSGQSFSSCKLDCSILL